MLKSVENLRKKKKTGGRRTQSRGRRIFQIDRYAAESQIGKEQKRIKPIRGTGIKIASITAEYANVSDKTTKKIIRSKIIKTIKNKSNRDYERRGVLTKGSTIETEHGIATITSRPGQDGVINCILVK